MESSLGRYIWKYSRRQQIVIVLMTFAVFPMLYLTLQIPKWIINHALGEPEQQKELLGLTFDPVPYLATLCFALLGLIIASGLLKMRINTLKGIIGERLVRRMRYTLVQNILRFPLPYFSRISSGELISTITAETEPLGGYIGDSCALPLFQGGTMLTILVFMFAQDVVFGLVSIALIPVQGYVIPKLQQQVNLLKKERVRHVRKLSERIGETVSGATEIRLHGTQPYTLSEFSRRLGQLFTIRLEIFRKKFFMKFLNNTIGHITPFMFYLFGGYLVIKGDLTIGALVAAIGAYKDLTSPWRELLNFYQLHEDSKIKFQQVRELFFPENLVEIDDIQSAPQAIRLEGDLVVRKVSWRNEGGEVVLSGVDLQVSQGTMVAITGDYAIRRNRIAQLLAGLEVPAAGSITIGDRKLSEFPDSVLRRGIALQGPDPHLFAGSIVENMEYGLQQYEPATPDQPELLQAVNEAKAAGNRSPIDSDWLDYRQAGLDQRERSLNWYQQVIRAMGSEEIVYDRSMYEVFDPTDRPVLADRLLAARHLIRDRLARRGEQSPVTQFDPDNFNPGASISENLLYGIAADQRLNTSGFLVHDYFIETLEAEHLIGEAQRVGLQAGRSLLFMIDNNTLPAGVQSHFGLDDEERIERVRYTVDNYVSSEKLSRPCFCLLITLFLLIIPDRHRFVQLDARVSTRLLQARREFSANLPPDLQDAVEVFDENRYHARLSVQDNLLFGRISTSDPSSERAVRKIIQHIVDELDLRKDLILLLGDSQVGIRGSRLPLIAKHHISLGRALIKRPDILIFHDALAPMDQQEQRQRRSEIRSLLPDTTIIWIAREIDDVEEFDKVLQITEAGGLVELDSEGMPVEPEASPDTQHESRGKRSSNALELISNAVLFAELSASQLRYLAQHSYMISVAAASTLYERDDEADSAWLVVSGEVESTNRNGETIGRFKRPEVFGAIEVLADSRRILTAAAVTDAMLLRIDGAAIETVAMSDPRVSRKLLRSLTQQWRR